MPLRVCWPLVEVHIKENFQKSDRYKVRNNSIQATTTTCNLKASAFNIVNHLPWDEKLQKSLHIGGITWPQDELT